MLRKKIIRIVISFFLLIIIGILLFDRLHLGLVRFLDIDEGAYLHWSYNVSQGLVPYKDFFFAFTPFYLYFIAPILVFSGKTFAYVTGARIAAFAIFCIGTIFLYKIAKSTSKGRLFALFGVLVFVYLPLPADKWIEVRPDCLGVVISLAGVWLTIEAIKGKRVLFGAGFFLSLGTVVNPKLFFYPLCALAVLMFEKVFLGRNKLRLFIAGLIIPLIILTGLLFSSGDFGRALYSIFILQKDAGVLLGSRNPIRADLFFYPNDAYYGEAGYNFNYFANLVIYFLAMVTAIVRLISFLSREKKESILFGFFLPLLFLTNLAAYIHFFPLKHTQYLLGASVWVAYFFADFVFGAAELLKKKKTGQIASGLLLPVLVLLLGLYGHRMNQIKASRTYTEGVRFYNEAKKYFSDEEYVFDLTGGSLFYKDPYYICCLPYGEYLEVLKFKTPDLESALRAKEVKHIFIQFPDRVKILPNYQAKILDRYYTSASDLSSSILFAGAKINLEKESQREFELIAPGWYRIYWNEVNITAEQVQKLILLDGKIILSNPIYLGKGTYSLTRLKDAGVAKLVYIGK